MRKLLSLCLIIVITFQATFLNVSASLNIPSEYPTSEVKLIFPNGNMAYFEALGESGESYDFSEYTSGVYNNCEPRKLLYSINFELADIINSYFYEFSSDGVFYVKYSLFSDSLPSSPVMAFYKNGVEYKTIPLSDIVNDFDSLEVTTSGAIWNNYCKYDYVNNALHVSTPENQFISFDIYSGEVLRKSDSNPFDEIKIGTDIVITGNYYAGDIGEEVPVWVKCKTHIVSEIKEDKILLGEENGINSWVYTRDIISYTDFG